MVSLPIDVLDLVTTRSLYGEHTDVSAVISGTSSRKVDHGLGRIYSTAITGILTASALEDVLAADVLESALGWWRPMLTS